MGDWGMELGLEGVDQTLEIPCWWLNETSSIREIKYFGVWYFNKIIDDDGGHHINNGTHF